MDNLDSDFPTFVYRPDPMLRRMAIFYGLIAFPWILGVFAFFDQYIRLQAPGAGDPSQIPAIAICGLMIIVPTLLLLWRSKIRIDAEGIWRRRFIRWDLWPWDAILGGKIREMALFDGLINTEKPMYWRYLNLSFLSQADRLSFLEVIRNERILSLD